MTEHTEQPHFDPGESGAEFFVFKDAKTGLFKWWLSLESNVSAASSDGAYDTEQECIDAIMHIKREVPSAHIQSLQMPGPAKPITPG